MWGIESYLNIYSGAPTPVCHHQGRDFVSQQSRDFAVTRPVDSIRPPASRLCGPSAVHNTERLKYVIRRGPHSRRRNRTMGF
jgi:hypothetical protein